VVLGGKLGEAGLGYRIREDVRQAISAGNEGIGIS
jgi:ribosomal protein S5